MCVCGKEGGPLGHDAPEMGTRTPRIMGVEHQGIVCMANDFSDDLGS